MKNLNILPGLVLAGMLAVLPMAGCADKQTSTEVKPYPLDTCLVCDMKLGQMGKPYSFAYKGQEIRICDQSEKAQFDRDPAKYLKKLADTEAGMKK